MRLKRTINRPLIIDGWDFSPGQLLSPRDVAGLFGVGRQTVTRWADTGKLACVRTPGGTRRFSRQQVEHFLSGGPDRDERRRADRLRMR